MNHPDCPCRHRALAGLGADDELAPTSAGANTAAQRADGSSAFRSILIGTATGLTVWFLTRMIDGGSRRRR